MLTIGLEVHCQLHSARKLFSMAPIGKVSSFDLGLPGSLPIVNMHCIGIGVKIAKSLQCRINSPVRFDRKHYSYPDLFPGYQITQKFNPIGVNGLVHTINKHNERLEIGIECVQLEQDTAKTVMVVDGEYELDAGRAGVALAEIVTKPDIRSAYDAVATLKALQSVIRTLGVGSGNMEDGSLRCDVNVSKNRKPKIELKNLNSFKDVYDSIEYESIRFDKESIVMETRRWDPLNKKSFSTRSKETQKDYKFIPDADIPLIHIPDCIVSEIKVPQLPYELALELINKHQIDQIEALKIAHDPLLLHYFNVITTICPAKDVLKWISDFEGMKNQHSTSYDPTLKNIAIYNAISPHTMKQFLSLVSTRQVTGLNTKYLFSKLINTTESFELLAKPYLNQDINIKALIDQLLNDHPSQKQDAFSTNLIKRKKVKSWLVGKVLKQTHSKVDPKLVTKALEDKLSKSSKS